MSKFNLLEWKQERFRISKKNSDLFGFPVGRGFNGRLESRNDEFKQQFNEKIFLKKYKMFLEMKLEEVNQALNT